jgi:hypothetical protein
MAKDIDFAALGEGYDSPKKAKRLTENINSNTVLDFAALGEGYDSQTVKQPVANVKPQSNIKPKQVGKNSLASFVDTAVKGFSKYRSKVKADTERKNQERLTLDQPESNSGYD